MSWSAPMTAVAGATFTAAQFNQYVRDNLLECPTAKATAVSQYAVSTGVNAMAMRQAVQNTVNVSETTTSTAFVDLTTPGPQVTVTTGTAALIIISAEINNNTASQAGRVGVLISGATSEAVNGNYTLRQETNGTAEFQRCSAARLHTGLTAGSNTFKMQYATVGVSTAAFNFRDLIVVPF